MPVAPDAADVRVEVLVAGGDRARGVGRGQVLAAHPDVQRGQLVVLQGRGEGRDELLLLDGVGHRGDRASDLGAVADGQGLAAVGRAERLELVPVVAVAGVGDTEHAGPRAGQLTGGGGLRGAAGVVVLARHDHHVGLELRLVGQRAGGLAHGGPERGLAPPLLIGGRADLVDGRQQTGGIGGEALQQHALVVGGVDRELLGERPVVGPSTDPLACGLLGRGQRARRVHRLGGVEDQRVGDEPLRGHLLGLDRGHPVVVDADGALEGVGLRTGPDERRRVGRRVERVDGAHLPERGVGGLGPDGRGQAQQGQGEDGGGDAPERAGAHWPTVLRLKPSGWKTSWPRRMPRSASFSANLGRTPVAFR